MGPGRDEAKTDDKAKWKDASLCKSFLIGFCCRDRSVLGGKRGVEACTRLHSEMTRQQFEASRGPEKESYRNDCVLASLRDMELLLKELERSVADRKAELREEQRDPFKQLPPKAGQPGRKRIADR